MPRFLADAAYASLTFGKHETARRLFEAVGLLTPTSPVGPTGLSVSLLALGQPRPAERAARRGCRMIADRTTTAAAYLALARALNAQNKPDEAARQWRRAAEIDPSGCGIGNAT